MKITLFACFTFLLAITANAQRNTDFGVLIGGSYYFGDINPGRQFYGTQPAYGALVRYNINKRYAIRISGLYASLRADAADFPEQVIPYNPSAKFTANLVDFSLTGEFNFLPYITGKDKWLKSTYVSAGLGYSKELSSSTFGSSPGFFSLPFGVGAKLNITDRLSTGVEWTLHKTFNDVIDGVTSPQGKSMLHNNDWYSFFGLFITYKFFKFAADCPVYKKQNSK